MGDLVRVSRGLWRPADDVADLSGRCAALLSVTPTGTVVSGLTAARLHGMWLPAGTRDTVEMTVAGRERRPRQIHPSTRSEFRLRRRDVREDEVGITAGLPVTTPARTWVDLAQGLTEPQLVAAGDSVLRQGVPTDEIARLVSRAHRRRGVLHARRCLPLLDPRSESPGESHLRAGLVLAGLPSPSVNQDVYDNVGQWLARPDLSYPLCRLALEYQGAHHADPGQMRRDLTRVLDLQRARWTVLCFGPAEVFGRLDQVVAQVRWALHRADRTDRRLS